MKCRGKIASLDVFITPFHFILAPRINDKIGSFEEEGGWYVHRWFEQALSSLSLEGGANMVTEPATISPADRMYTVELALKKKKIYEYTYTK